MHSSYLFLCCLVVIIFLNCLPPLLVLGGFLVLQLLAQMSKLKCGQAIPILPSNLDADKNIDLIGTNHTTTTPNVDSEEEIDAIGGDLKHELATKLFAADVDVDREEKVDADIDLEYEFDAPQFVDFSRPETHEEAQEAELWFRRREAVMETKTKSVSKSSKSRSSTLMKPTASYLAKVMKAVGVEDKTKPVPRTSKPQVSTLMNPTASFLAKVKKPRNALRNRFCLGTSKIHDIH